MTDISPPKIADGFAEYHAMLMSFAQTTEITSFTLDTALPKKGRIDLPLAATERLTLVLKAYASGGENALHSHDREDHAFLVLQGEAEFFGDGDETFGVIGPFNGIFIPRGARYRFEAVSSVPLVLFRVAAIEEGAFQNRLRSGADGKPLGGYDAANKQVGYELDENMRFPPG